MEDTELFEIQKHMADFTTDHYRQLLRLALKNYEFTSYTDKEKTENFILWRHDCDYSLNRSLRLAQIEAEEGVKSTYFLLPHCDFYNLLEKRQSALIHEIIGLGHHIGLHFDAGFYDLTSEEQLDSLVRKEAGWLQDWFGVNVGVFSFHNPDAFSLGCEKDSYGGLVNCYSAYFKNNVGYCSDSNGYWRFRRMHDVLQKADDKCLQILTHPGWWQDTVMAPRERIERCVQGRAAATMADYDSLLLRHSRKNVLS